jgi:hypothetical protein
MKKIYKILIKHFNIRSLVICAMMLSTEMSMGQDANLQRQNVDSDSLYAWIQEHQGNPLEMGNQIREAIPGTGPIFNIGLGDSYFDLKDKLYDKIGLRIGVSYQMLYQSASTVLPDADNQALSYWVGFMTKWTLINRKKGKNQGHLVFSMFERNPIGNFQIPSNFGPINVGSITTAIEFTTWDFSIENLYWEQWIDFKKHKLMIRVGNLAAASLIDPFRFKDARKNFTTGPFCYHVTKPDPTFGFGVLAKWMPSSGNGLYVSGAMTDMNGDPNSMGFDWSTISYGQFFYGVEVGKNWVRGKGDYDHLHILVFYATDRSSRNADVAPNEPGWGFSILGEKQWNRWVGFAKWTYNTAEGGGGLGTFSNNTGTAGVVYKNLFNITGTTGLGLYLMDPIDDIFGEDTGLQYGMEVYWNVLLTRNIIVTPGIHLQWNPTLNPEANFVAMPHIKFRIQI